MYRIDASTAVTLKPAKTPVGTQGYFFDGDPALGIPATVVTDEWLNTVMDEISGVIEGAGLVLDKANDGQLLSAIQALIAGLGLGTAAFRNVGIAPTNVPEVLSSTGKLDPSIIPSTAVDVLRKELLLNSLLDATANGAALRVLNAVADTYANASKIDAGLSSGYAHRPVGAFVENSGGAASQIFNDSGTFTVPNGITQLTVKVWGAGGGGSATYGGGHGTSGGGGGGYSEEVISGLTPGTNISLTVGVGGIGATTYAFGTAGGTSSFGAYLQATGGGGGTNINPLGGAAGVGSGGTININGSPGIGVTGGQGTGGNAGGTGGGAGGIAVSEPGAAPGGGGSGGNYVVSGGGLPGGNGANGRVVVEWTSSYDNMTLVSTSYEASTEPGTGYLLAIVEPVDAVVYGTDVLADMSKNDGTTWETVSISKVGVTDEGYDVVFGDVVFVATGDQTVRTRWRTAGNKHIKLHGSIPDAET